MKFNGKILVIGCGSVAQCAVPLVLKLFETPAKDITIIDFVDNRSRVKEALQKGVNYVIERITKENYARILGKYVGSGDLIIDLAWNIETISLLKWCRDNRVLYVNTSVEEWNPYRDIQRDDPTKYTLYARQMEIRRKLEEWGEDKDAPTAIVDHGANPGLVSHFTKYALIEIAKKIVEEKPKDYRAELLRDAIKRKDFAALAQLEGVKVIHISERDSQITDKPKKVSEFVNTWSIEGFYEEGVGPAELGWGTHERYLPSNAYLHKKGPCNQVCLGSIGIKTWMRSWVPSGEITGMLIRHGEAFGISDRLTVWENGEAVYRPTVHYVYCPCDCAVNSLHELEMRQFKLQEDQRIMTDEITDGRDELGVLLMGHDFTSWWCGSLLDIHKARSLVPHQQATTLQVAISAVSAAMWMIENPKKGYLLPDDVDHDYILDISMPYIEPFVSQPSDWTPLKNLNTKFTKFNIPRPNKEDIWQFIAFMVDPRELILAYGKDKTSRTKLETAEV